MSCTIFSVQYPLYTVNCTLYNVLCTLYTVISYCVDEGIVYSWTIRLYHDYSPDPGYLDYIVDISTISWLSVLNLDLVWRE